jgi:hypothetical protein
MIALEQVQESWRCAGKDLGFDFIAPFELEADGRKACFHGLIRDFGGKNGTLIFASERFDEDLCTLSELAKKNDYFFSCIGMGYKSYDRKEFIATLDDWGWIPKDRRPPAWYAGTPWGT